MQSSETTVSTIVSSEQELIQVRSNFAFDQFIRSFIFYNIFFSYGLHVLLFMMSTVKTHILGGVSRTFWTCIRSIQKLIIYCAKVLNEMWVELTLTKISIEFKSDVCSVTYETFFVYFFL